MTDPRPPRTRRELRQMQARDESKQPVRPRGDGDTAPGAAPGAVSPAPEQPERPAQERAGRDAQAPQAALPAQRRERRRGQEQTPGTLFVPRVAPAPAPSERPVPPVRRPSAPAAGTAATDGRAPTDGNAEARPQGSAQRPGRDAAAQAPREGTQGAVRDERRSRRLERLRRQAEAAGLTGASPASAPSAAGPAPSRPAQAEAPAGEPTLPAAAAPANADSGRLSDETALNDLTVLRSRRAQAPRQQPPVPDTASGQTLDAAPPVGDASDTPAVHGAHGRPNAAVDAPSAAPHHEANHAAPQAPGVSAEQRKQAPGSRPPAQPSPRRGTGGPVNPAPTADGAPAASSAPAVPVLPAAPAAPASDAPAQRSVVPAEERQAPPTAERAEATPQTHRRRPAPTQHTPEVAAALGASPALETAQAEIEAMAAAREAALRRALSRRTPTRASESFDSALGLPPGATQTRPTPAQVHRTARVADQAVPETAQRPIVPPRESAGAVSRPAAPAGTEAGSPSAPSPASTSFSDLLGIPAPAPLPKRTTRGGRRARAAAAEAEAAARQSEAQRRLENTGLIAPVTQAISVSLPPAAPSPALEGTGEAKPLAAQQAHGLDPLEYRSAGVGRMRWGLWVVCGSVVVAVTSVIVALTL